MRSPTVTMSTSFNIYSIADKLTVYNIFNQITRNNLTGYRYGVIILVTSQVTSRSFGGENVVNVNLLKSYMVRAGYTQKKLAQELGISEQTLTRKLKKRVFGTDEASKIVELLSIDNPQAVFFGH